MLIIKEFNDGTVYIITSIAPIIKKASSTKKELYRCYKIDMQEN